MPSLVDIQKQADRLSREDQVGLLTHLIHSLEDAPLGADDSEVMRREAEMDAGSVVPISHEEFRSQARPCRP